MIKKIKLPALVVALTILQAGCTLPSAVKLPSQQVIDQNTLSVEDLKNLPEPIYHIMPGDSLRIVRYDEDVINDRAVTFEVRSDGNLSYPYAGSIKVAYKTIKEVEDEITSKLVPVYQQPQVNINVIASPSNKVFVGGAVRLPNAFELANINTVEQAIIAAGGLLNSADARHIALMRLNNDGNYQVYFSNFDKILNPDSNVRGIKLARGDVLFIPKSAIGNAVDGVDMYLNQLIPFTKSLGVGFSYVIRQPKVQISD